MRKVMVSELKKQADGKWKLEEKGEAIFHQFGCDYEEFESGPGNFSTAIIEWPSGLVGNVPVRNIIFIDAPKCKIDSTGAIDFGDDERVWGYDGDMA